MSPSPWICADLMVSRAMSLSLTANSMWWWFKREGLNFRRSTTWMTALEIF